MSRSAAMEVSKGSKDAVKQGHKRKRSFSESSALSDGKRPTRSQSSLTPDKVHRRLELKDIYRSYVSLKSKDCYRIEWACDRLIDAADGSPSEKHLAAVLLPKFVAKAAKQSQSVATCLGALACFTPAQPGQKGPLEVTAARALRSLGAICELAAKARLQTTLAKALEHLLRHIPHARVREANSGGYQPKAADIEDDPTGQQIAARDLLACLLTAFRSAPEDVLLSCARIIEEGDDDLCHGAEYFVKYGLLGGLQEPESAASEDAMTFEDVLTILQGLSQLITDFVDKGRASRKAGAHLLVNLYTKLLEATCPDGSAEVHHSAAAVQPSLPEAGPDVFPGTRPEPPHPEVAPRDISQAPPEAAAAMPLPQRGSVAQPFATQMDEPFPHQHEGAAMLDAQMHAATIPCADLKPGDEVCLTCAALWLGHLTPRLSDAAIKAECATFGTVLDIQRTANVPSQEAFVVFADIRDAACCYEAMCDAKVWSAAPLSVLFCEEVHSSGLSRADQKIHVWVGGVGSPRGEEGVMMRLADAGVPAPLSILRVGGSRPGLILQFASAILGSEAVRALARHTQAQNFLGSARRSAPASVPALRGQGCSTLWIGQVGSQVDENRMIAAFRQHGKVMDWKVLRRSNCAFIDFETAEHAAAAKDALQNADFGGSVIRIEFKDEGGRAGGNQRRELHRGQGFPRGPVSPGLGMRPYRDDHRHPVPRGPPSPYRQARSFARSASPAWIQDRANSVIEPLRHGWDTDRTVLEGPAPVAHRADPGIGGAMPASSTSMHLSLQPAKSTTERGPSRPSKWDVQETEEQPKVPAPSMPAGPPQAAMPPPPLPKAITQALPDSFEKGIHHGCAAGVSDMEQKGKGAGMSAERVGQSWMGVLAKSGIPVCDVISTGVPVPEGWPSTLDVTVRADLTFVLGTVYLNCPPEQRAVYCLQPAPHSSDPDRKARHRTSFINFINSLSGRSRAGVVQKLTTVKPGHGPQTLYLLPPSTSVAERLKVSWDQRECIFALSVPAGQA